MSEAMYPPEDLLGNRERETWIVEIEGECYGPFPSKDSCCSFAANVSREPNDWSPIKLIPPVLTFDAPL